MRLTEERKWHVLRSVSSCAVPEVCVFVDTEAWDTLTDSAQGTHELTFRLGVATVVHLEKGGVTDRHSVSFYRPEEFWALLDKVAPRRGTLWVFSHNLAVDFTLLGGWRRLEGADVEILSLVLEDPPTIVCYRQGRKTTQWVDVLNYWRLPLGALGEAVGRPRLPRPAAAAPQTDWADYCRRDVDLIEEILCQLITTVRETLCCSFRPTAASLSWHAWRKCSTFPRVLIHGNYRALSLERASLFGGRLECCAAGFVPRPVTIWDATSLYPSIMCRQQLPTQLCGLIQNPRKDDVRAYLREYLCVADLSLGSGHPAFPLRLGGGVVHSGGEGRFVLPDPEVRAAFAAAAVRHVHRIALYAGGSLFRGFLDPLLAAKARARKAGLVVQELCYKLLCNSLSGKPAQRGRKWVTDERLVGTGRWGYWWKRHPDSGEVVRCRSVAGVRQYLHDRGEPANSFPAVSALIAGHGRRVLEGCCDAAGRAAVLYRDTDALHCDAAASELLNRSGLVRPEEPGYLREVHSGPTAFYWGPKNYRVGSLRVLGCVAASATEVADGIFLQDSFAGVERTLSSGRLDRVVTQERCVDMSEASYRARRQYAAAHSDW